jgi:hypothetical protein
MVVNNLDTIRPGLCPDEADPVLIVYANAVLTSPVSSKGFEAVRWRRPEVVERSRCIQLVELSTGYSPKHHGTGPASTT